MYPFFVLGVSHTASDEEVRRRYQQLTAAYPPDRAPEAFAQIRAAFDAIKTSRSRIEARLHYFDETGRSFSDEWPAWLVRQPRPRLSPEQLAAWLRKAQDDCAVSVA